MSVRDLIIIGAGPSGLAAAIAASQAGLDYIVVEKGLLANSIFHFPPQMTFFTTPDLLEIGGLPFVTPYEKPTRHEALRYYRRVVERFDLQIAFGVTVDRVTPVGEGASRVFELVTTSRLGASETLRARHVVLAIGYYDQPNRLGIPGEDLPHVAHYYGEPHQYYHQKVLIVGGKNSAAIAALELFRGGAQVTLVHRRATLSDRIKYWIRPDIDNRIKEGSIPAYFKARVLEITPTQAVVETGTGEHVTVEADSVLLLTGYHPDFRLMTQAGVRLDERSAPVHDPATLETSVPGLFVAGGLLGGLDTGTIFIENGRFHGEQIVKTILAARPQ